MLFVLQYQNKAREDCVMTCAKDARHPMEVCVLSFSDPGLPSKRAHLCFCRRGKELCVVMSLLPFCCSHLVFSLLGDFLTNCSEVKSFSQWLFPPSWFNSPFPVFMQANRLEIINISYSYSFQLCLLLVKHQSQAL